MIAGPAPLRAASNRAFDAKFMTMPLLAKPSGRQRDISDRRTLDPIEPCQARTFRTLAGSSMRFSVWGADPAEPNLPAVPNVGGRGANRSGPWLRLADLDFADLHGVELGLVGLQAGFRLTLVHHSLQS